LKKGLLLLRTNCDPIVIARKGSFLNFYGSLNGITLNGITLNGITLNGITIDTSDTSMIPHHYFLPLHLSRRREAQRISPTRPGHDPLHRTDHKLCQVPNRSQKVIERVPAIFQAACLNCITAALLRLFRNAAASSLCYNNIL
jgi:hypothetical protein